MKPPPKYKPLFGSTKKPDTSIDINNHTNTPKNYKPLFSTSNTPSTQKRKKENKRIKKKNRSLFSFSTAIKNLKSLVKDSLPQKSKIAPKNEGMYKSEIFGELTQSQKKSMNETGLEVFRETVDIYAYLYTIDKEEVVKYPIDVYDTYL